ncbi:sulfate ABC transporter permease subunit [Lacticaseibacillus sp. GG6-2]
MFNAKHIRYPLIALAWIISLGLIGLPIGLIIDQALSDGLTHYLTALGALITLNALNLTVIATVITVMVDLILGIAAAWVTTFYDFPGKKILNAIIDLPVAVSPVIAGLIFILTFSRTGWAAPLLAHLHFQIIYARPAIVLATIFVTFPLVARTIAPVMAARGREAEQAAAFMGASWRRILQQITLPAIRVPLAQGIVLAASRALGEFGAVAVVSGSIPNQTLTLPLLIQTLYDEFKFSDAFAVATILLATTIVILALEHHLLERSTANVHPDQSHHQSL